MAGLPFKRGLNPVQYGKAADYSGAVNVYRVSSDEATAIYFGDPVILTANGYAQRVSAAASVPGDNILGVAVGAFWIDPTDKTPKESRYLPAATSSGVGNYNGLRFTTTEAGAGLQVIDDLDQVYAIKATLSITQATLGDRVTMVGAGGNTVTGQSSIAVSTGGGAGDFLECVGLFKGDEFITPTSAGGTGFNDWLSPETVLLVKLKDS